MSLFTGRFCLRLALVRDRALFSFRDKQSIVFCVFVLCGIKPFYFLLCHSIELLLCDRGSLVFRLLLPLNMLCVRRG